MKILKIFKNFKFVIFLAAILWVAVVDLNQQTMANTKFLFWVDMFALYPFFLLSSWMTHFAEPDNAYVSRLYFATLLVSSILYYGLLIYFLFRLIDGKKHKLVVLFITTYLILHGLCTLYAANLLSGFRY